MTVNDDDGATRPAEAVHALRDRGVDNGEQLLAYGTPDEILAACHRWDGRKGVGPGLLASWVRNREFEDPKPPPQNKGAIMRARFDEYARRFPEGTAVMTHAQLDKKLRPGNADDCPGRMVVQATTSYPVMVLECEACEFEQGIPARGLHLLGAPALELTPEPAKPEQPF